MDPAGRRRRTPRHRTAGDGRFQSSDARQCVSVRGALRDRAAPHAGHSILTSSVLYLGCPPPDRAHCQRQLDAAKVSVVWVDSIASALAELRSETMSVLIDLSCGSQAVHHTHEVRSRFPLARVFAVTDAKRPALTTDAVLAGATDVFPRPLSVRSAAAV